MSALHPFDLVEDLILMYLERVALPHWMDDNDFTEYLRYLKIQHDEPVELSTFTVFRILGKGGFGLVKGCRTTTTGRMYALKEMDKKWVKKRNSKKLCDQENQALRLVDSPFCVTLKYAFQTPAALVLVIDLMIGGDLRYHLHRNPDRRFPESWARYYGARIALGLTCLHEAGIVYRDLKPENVLVADDGRTRLSDMGLAVRETPHLRGIAGTPGYCAPEMLTGKSYDRVVDWFSFGCTMYEFVARHSPFRSKAALEFQGIAEKGKAINAATCQMNVEWPHDASPDFLDLCKRLLSRDPSIRLGRRGLDEVTSHPFFKGLDWDMLKADDFSSSSAPEAPPFVPGKSLNIQDAEKIGEFADLGNEVTIEPGDFPEDEWNYKSERAFQSEVVWLLQHGLAKDSVRQNTTTSSTCTIL